MALVLTQGYLMALEVYAPTKEQRDSAHTLLETITEVIESSVAQYKKQLDMIKMGNIVYMSDMRGPLREQDE
jgi:hypothetical protein